MKKALIALLTLTLISGIAVAAPGGNGGGDRGGRGGDSGPAGGNAIVADNGTLLVTRVVSDSATDTRSTQVVAITPAGATAWTASLGGHGFRLSGNNLLTTSDATGTDGVVKTTIAARSVATGAQAWSITLDGRVTDLEPFSGGTYAIVVIPAGTAGGTATRKVVAISNSGTQLFSVTLS